MQISAGTWTWGDDKEVKYHRLRITSTLCALARIWIGFLLCGHTWLKSLIDTWVKDMKIWVFAYVQSVWRWFWELDRVLIMKETIGYDEIFEGLCAVQNIVFRNVFVVNCYWKKSLEFSKKKILDMIRVRWNT